MTSSPTLPPQQQLTSATSTGREVSTSALTPRRRSASASLNDITRSHSVPPHLMSSAAAAATTHRFPASPTVSESSSSHGSLNSASSSSTSNSSAVNDDEELDRTVGSFQAQTEPRLVKSTSTPAGLTASHATTRSTSATSTSSASSLLTPASASASSPSLYTSSSPASASSSNHSSPSSAASLLSSTLASLSSTVASLFRPSSPSHTSSAPTARLIPYYTLDAVAQHNTAHSFWTIVHGRVYDLTTYLPLHPGGYRLLFKNGGGDSTSDFVGLRHSKRAIAVLDAYWIGDVVGTRPMREVPAGLGSAVKTPRDGCAAVGSFGGSGVSGGKKAGGGGGGMLGDGLHLGEGVEGVRRSHSAGPSNNARVVPLNTKYQHHIAPSPTPGQAVNIKSPSASRPPPQPPSVFTINLIAPSSSSTTPPSAASLTSVSASSPSSSVLSLDVAPLTFVVSSIKHLSADTVQLVFRLPASASSPFSMPLSGHITIEVPSTSPDGPLRRQYTPIASTTSSFTLLVKRYTAKQLGSHYLASLNVGQHIAVHGPYTSLAHSITTFADVVLLCMGSGVTPMYQLLQHIHKLSTSSSSPAPPIPRVHLLYSVRLLSDVWLRQPIDNTFALHPFDWHHTYLLSRADATHSDERRGRLDADVLYGWLEQCGVVLGGGVLCCVCGTDEYTSAVSDWLRQRWRMQSGGSGGAESDVNIHIF